MRKNINKPPCHQEWLTDVTHHDDAPWLFRSAHAHNGSHADGGALEVNTTEERKQEVMWHTFIYSRRCKGSIETKCFK